MKSYAARFCLEINLYFRANHGLYTVERAVHRISYSVVSRLGTILVRVKNDTMNGVREACKKKKLYNE